MSEMDDFFRDLQSGPPPLRVFTLEELLAMKEMEIEWIVDRLIPRGSLTLLAGRPKAGKSLLAIDLLASVAFGCPFLGRPTTQGSALYVPAEDAPDVVARRLRDRLAGQKGVPLHVLPADGTLDQTVRIDDPTEIGLLAKALRRCKPDLIVLDPFRELHHLPENDSVSMAAVLRPLRLFARKTGCAIVLVHHRNKHVLDPSLAARGSSAIIGGVDITITLDLDGDSELKTGQTISARVEGRYGPRQHLAARLTPGLRWEALDPRSLQRPDIRSRILNYLQSVTEPATAAKIARDLELPGKTVANTLTALQRAGRVTRSGHGSRFNPYLYRLGDGPTVR